MCACKILRFLVWVLIRAEESPEFTHQDNANSQIANSQEQSDEYERREWNKIYLPELLSERGP